jgi:hypothetical protein
VGREIERGGGEEREGEREEKSFCLMKLVNFLEMR